jgi:secreted PhoX family phosphatase
VYQGSDSNPGYLYKFVADNEKDLNSGNLYVFVGQKAGTGNWIQLNNTTKQERNSTLLQSVEVGATIFGGIEDVEIGHDGMVYFAVKAEDKVYRFRDSDPLAGKSLEMETYVGAMEYTITHLEGETLVSWGTGNDNLVFDGEGNLWVLQDGSKNYVWVVDKDHTQENPKVKLFGIAPIGSEPTGITFTPDYKYLFMSIQGPDGSNNITEQIDAAGNSVKFDNHVSLVIALKENLGVME